MMWPNHTPHPTPPRPTPTPNPNPEEPPEPEVPEPSPPGEPIPESAGIVDPRHLPGPDILRDAHQR